MNRHNKEPWKPSHRRNQQPTKKTQIKVLMISENISVLHTISEMLSRSRECAFRTFMVDFAGKARDAVERFSPDIVLVDNWFDKSEKGYWDVMVPVLRAYPKLKIIVIASRENKNGEELPTESEYFSGRLVVMKEDALKHDGNLAKAIVAEVNGEV